MIQITSLEHTNNVCSIRFDNIIADPNCFKFIKEIAKEFFVERELFWGHYKIDSIYLSYKTTKQYEADIRTFFTTFGNCCSIDTKKIINNAIGRELSAGRCTNNEKAWEIIEKVFHYYLETTVFCPHINWDDFLKIHTKYMSITAKDFIKRKYTDFLIQYVDSGDFSIVFNTDCFSINKVYNSIQSKTKIVDGSMSSTKTGEN